MMDDTAFSEFLDESIPCGVMIQSCFSGSSEFRTR